MKRLVTVAILAALMVSSFGLSYAEEDVQKTLIIKEAKEKRKSSVTVEAHLTQDNILEAVVTARIQGSKPKIENVILFGPKLGRLVPKVKRTVYATGEDEDPFLTTRPKGYISSGDKKEIKKLKGTMSREFYKFMIPVEKIIPGKRYELWVKIRPMQNETFHIKYEFELKELAQLLSK